MSNELIMSKEQFEELIQKLDTLINLTAANIFRGRPLTESVPFLSDLGLKSKEIAKILGTTSASVRTTKSLAKKDKKKREAKSKTKDKNVKGGEKSVEN